MGLRFNKNEKAQRAAAQRTLADPTATASASYHARLLLRQTQADAEARSAAKTAQRPAEPLPRVHRCEVPPDPNAKAFLDALRAMLEREDETASVAPRAPATSNEICPLCLLPRGVCGHGGQQSNNTR